MPHDGIAASVRPGIGVEQCTAGDSEVAERLVEALKIIAEIGNHGVESFFGIRHVYAYEFGDNSHKPGGENSKQNGSADSFNQEDRCNDDAKHCKDRPDAAGVHVDIMEIDEADDGGVIGDHDFSALQGNESDEYADTHGDGGLERMRNTVEQFFANGNDGENQEQDAFDKDGEQGELPAVAHANHHGVAKEGVDAKARGKCKGVVRHNTHDGRTDCRCDDGGDEDAALGHARCRQNVGVYRQNVGHGHEGNQARQHFVMDGGIVFA